MRRLLATLLRRVGLLHYDLLARRVASYPEAASVSAGELIHVVDGAVEKWACLRCPGGCGTLIPLSLNHKRRPRWAVTTDWFHRPTVKPSVHQTNECGCHFIIARGRVNWYDGGHLSSKP